MNNPKISVIVPVYNVGKYLGRCIDSIMAQTFADFELLLVDDGSCDRSGEICDRYAAGDNRVRVFHKANGGVSSARNVGIDNACGDWLCFCDADDELFPEALSVMYGGIGRNIGFVMAGYECCSEDGTKTYGIDERQHTLLDYNSCILAMFSPLYYRYQGYLWNKLFHRKEIREHSLRFNEEIFFNEDRLFVVEYLSKAKPLCYYTTEPVYKYFVRDSSAMSSVKKSFNRKFVTDVYAFEIMLRQIRLLDSLENIRVVKWKLYCSVVRLREMMSSFNVADKDIDRQMNSVLKRNLSVFDRWHFKLTVVKDSLKRRLTFGTL